MAMTGRFDANFTSFYDAVQKAVIELKGFDAATGSVESSMNKMVDAFSGRQIMTEATIMTEAIEKIGGASKLTADELQRVGNVAAEAAEKYRAWGGEVPANIQKYADAAAEAKNQTNEWGTAMSAFSGIAGAFGLQTGISAVISFAKETMAAAEELDKLRSRTGITAEALQGFQAAGDVAGNTLEQIAGAALKLSENVAGGKASTVGALEDLGISVTDFKNLSTEEQFRAIAEAIKDIPDPMKQVETALALMGQKGVQVLPTLKSDIEGIGAATKKMSEDSTTFWANASTNMKKSAQEMKVTLADWGTYLFGGWTAGERAAKAYEDQVNRVKEIPAFPNPVPPGVPEGLKKIEEGLDATALAEIRNSKETAAWQKTFDDLHKTTFELAMQHEKQWREESDKQLKAHNQSVIDGLNQTKTAQAAYFDELDKQTLDSTDYQIKKVWEKVNAEKLAFKGSEEQRAAYNATVDAMGDAQTNAIMQKAADADAKKAAASDAAAAREIATIMATSAKTQAELDKMSLAANAAFGRILADANTTVEALGNVATQASVAGYNARLNPNGIDSSGGSQFAGLGGSINPNGSGAGIPDTPEGRLAILAAQQARNPLQPINTAYMFEGMPAVYQAPTYSGPGTTGGGGFSQTVNVTQPLGTSDQIARAVADALAQFMRGQGVRLPYRDMILTKALSGIARSGATRSGYPVFTGVKVPLYALSNVARSGATRSNYIGGRVFINIGGIDYGWGRVGAGVGVLAESLTKSDAINNTPVTLAFTARGWVPVEGADVIVTLGSRHNDRREFGGTILSTRHRYVGDDPIARNMLYDVSCIDYTWGLDRRKVSGNYTNASVAAIVASLMVSAPSGYTSRVDPDIGAELLDQITFTEQGLSSAFAQLATRVGGNFLCDFSKVVHLFFENTALSPPTIVNAVHPSLREITFTRDLSQVATRVLGSFGGSNALDAVAPGDIFLPVETGAWYLPAGGTVIVGQQRVSYTGVDNGGGGSLVGPGAAPSSVPNATLAPGAGVDVGTHDYAITYRTATGESVPGPRLTVPVGTFLPPAAAPTVGTPVSGATGPDPGAHDYAVSFVISTGETEPGPRVVGSTGLTAVPTAAPTPDALGIGDGPDEGAPHDYAVTFVTPSGETPAGPIGGQITTSSLAPPTPAPVVARTLDGTPALPPASYEYACTLVISGGGETMPGPSVAFSNYTGTQANPTSHTAYGLAGMPVTTDPLVTAHKLYRRIQNVGTFQLVRSFPPSVAQFGIPPPGPVNTSLHAAAGPLSVGFYYYAVTFLTAEGETTPSPFNTNGTRITAPGTAGQIDVTNIDRGVDGWGVTGRKLYRTTANGTTYRLVATFNDTTTTSYTDGTADASLGGAVTPTTNTTGDRVTTLGAVAPAASTAFSRAVHLSGIPTSPTGASARNLYRRSAGAGLRLAATIANNSATSYVDTTKNAALGVAPPSSNTALTRVIPVTAIPVGNALVTARKLYRTPANTGGGALKLVATLADNTTTSFTDTVTDAALGAAALTVGTAQAAQVQLSAIPIGAAAVTSRQIYRTKAGLTPLLLRATLADNTTTTYLDVLPDSTLGAAAPVSDLSGLQQPTGNIFAGSPTLICASVAGFRPAGGWATVGSQNVRYTGITGNALVGIPPNGPGAITATITYNTTAVAAAMLTGVPATGLGVIKYPILKGDPVNLWIQVDDLAAQAAVRVQLPGSDGIIEDEIQDGRLSYTEGRARCQARLDLLAALDSDGKVGVISVSYVCRDLNTIAGATTTINLGPPINLRGDFLIQRVGVNQFHIPNLHPTYTVEASSIRFSAEEMLRLLRQGAM